MKRKNRIYKWLIALWLLMNCQPALCAFEPATPPAAWRTTPTLSMDRKMTYQFRSTSPYPSVVGNSNIFYTEEATTPVGSPTPYHAPHRIRKGGIDDEDDDPSGDPQGYIDTPVGDIPWGITVIFALLFAYIKKKQYLCRR